MNPQEEKGFIEMFEAHGFENVSITTVAPPQHIIDWMRETGEFEDDELEATEKQMEYHKVTTKQGEFGIFVMAYLMLDLTGTGITVQELYPDTDPSKIPSDMRPITGLTGERKQLLMLWQLLVKKQNP